jgi:phosphoenolpyruvate carboxylase
MITGNNRADISMFESLQADQHTKTAMNQMAVFNDLNAVKGILKTAEQKVKQVEKLYEKYDIFSDSVTKKQEELNKLVAEDYRQGQVCETARELTDMWLRDNVIQEIKKEVERINDLNDHATKVKDAKSLEQAIGGSHIMKDPNGWLAKEANKQLKLIFR